MLRDGLEGVKVLYAPQCVFLPSSVVAKIKEFQRKGGVLVADKQLMKHRNNYSYCRYLEYKIDIHKLNLLYISNMATKSPEKTPSRL